jgi:predicted phage terminase large subunit-like protein
VLMLTAPPQHGKSSLIARCLPPYLFGRLTGELPAVRIAAASYAHALAQRNRRDAQSIMSEPIYRAIFPHTSLIDFRGTDNASDGLQVPGDGWLKGVGIGGPLTGFSVDCFAPGTLIDTDHGLISVENLYVHAKTVKVLSYNNGALDYASIKAIGYRQATRLYRITTDAGRVLEVTGNHPVCANGRYIAAAELAPGDVLVCAVPVADDTDGCRLRQEAGTRRHAVLQQSLYGPCAPHRQQELCGLRRAREVCEIAALPSVPESVSSEAHASARSRAGDTLRDMRQNVHESLEGGRSADMQQGVCGDSALATDGRCNESEFQGQRSVVHCAHATAQQGGIPLCKTGDTGSGRSQVCDLRGDEDATCTPYRRESASQFILQFADTVRELPSALSQPAHGRQYESDNVRMVEIIDGPVTVYDLQVEKTANLFANGVLAHNCGIIDDAVKNAQEALSEVTQERNRDWYDSVFLTRLQQRSGQVIIGTPWSANDLLAHIRKLYEGQPNFTLLSFPALNEPDEIGFNPDLPRGALVSSLHDEAKLREIKRSISQMWWAAMYQQTPLADLGAIFPRANVQYYRRADLPTFQRIVMSCDATFKDGEASDFVAVGVWGKTVDDRVYLLDYRRERLAFMATAQAIADLKRKYPQVSRIYIEKAANGEALIDMLHKHFPAIEGVLPLGSKEARAHAVSWVWAANNVLLPHPDESPGIAQWVAEITSFPDVKNDDTVDCMTIALQQLCLRSPIAALITRDILNRA